jgi:hypothetical protein
MPVPSTISELTQTAGDNSPTGGESTITADNYFRAHAGFIAGLRDGKGFTNPVTLASASTVSIGAQNSMFVEITGTTTITSFGTTYNGPRYLRFTGALVLTHNATTLNLPGGADITTIAGDVFLAIPNSTINGWNVSALNQFIDGSVTPEKMANAGAEYASYNRVTNGDFSIRQRSSASASNDTYCFDRWYLLIQSGSLDSITIGTDIEAGQPTSATISYSVPGVGPSKRFGIAQIIESINIRDLRSQAATLSARMRISEAIGLRYAILEWTGTADSVTSDVVNDWTSTNYTPGNFFIAGVNVIATGSITPSVNTWADVSCTGTFGASTNNAVVFLWMDSEFSFGGALRVGLVQLEQGSTKTPFKRVSYQQQLAECQRFAFVGAIGVAGYANAGVGMAQYGRWPVTMRTAPSISLSDQAYSNASSFSVDSITVDRYRAVATVTATGGADANATVTASADL